MSDAPIRPEEAPQLLAAWKLLKRRRWPFTAVFLLVLGSVAVWHLRTIPQFRGTAQVEIVRQLPRTGTLSDLPSLEPFLNQDYYNTQQKILMSRTLGERVVRKLSLRDAQGEPLAASAFGGRLDVTPVTRSRLLVVSYEDPDPKLAADVVNALLAEYASDMAERRVSGIKELRAKLEQESKELSKRLNEADVRLQEYNEKHKLTMSDEKQNVTVRRLDEAATQLTRAEQEVSQLEALVDQVKQGDADVERLFRLKPVLDSKLVQDLLLEESRIKQDIAEAAKKYKPKHPAYTAIEERMKDVRRAIEGEAKKIAEGIRTQHAEALSRRDKAREAIEELKREKLALDRVASGAEVLRRDRDAAKALYTNLVDRVMQSDILGSVEIANVSVVDKAVPPSSPSKPNLRLNAAVGLALAILLGAAAAVLVERLDTTVKTPEEIEDLTRLPVLGVIPVVDKEPAKVTSADPKSRGAEAFRTVRTSLVLAPRQGRAARAFLVMSSGPNEGKSVTASNLAISLAAQGHRTLLIDADFHRPAQHKNFGVENAKGLSTALVTEGPIEEFAQKTPIENLWLMTTGPTPPHPAELLGGPATKGRIEEARSKFDRVVIDSPPVCAVTDSLVIAPIVDAHLLVIQPGLTSREGLKRALSMVKGVGIALVGTVLNKVPERAEGYYAYYRYYGYYKSQ